MSSCDRRRTVIVVTTIYPLFFLEGYSNNLLKYGHSDHTTILVVGDKKTPTLCNDQAIEQRRRGIDVRYLSLSIQEDYLQRFPDLACEIPINSDNRRNVGFLMALEEGADVVVSIDDDNYCLPDVDFVGEHLKHCGTTVKAHEAVGHNGWFNLCSLLQTESCSELLYPRGFPYRLRDIKSGTVANPTIGKTSINVGLWLRDPDVDAIGRLYANSQISCWNSQQVLLGKGVRSPVNTQNTALTKEAMAAYYYVLMGAPLRGMKIDRFGDIFSGYFVQWCAEAVGDRVCVGGPVTDHRRNQHNLLMDLWNELAGIMMLEDLSVFLSDPTPPASSYLDAYRILTKRLDAVIDNLEGFIWTDESRQYMHKVASIMRTWADVYQAICR